MESQDPGFYRSARSRDAREFSSPRRPSRARMPSTSGYMVAAAAAAVALFFVLWWMLQGEENPWVPAGLAASVVMLVAVSAREVVMRRAWTRYILDDDKHGKRGHAVSGRSSKLRNTQTGNLQSAALRALQKQSAEADAGDAPETHRELYELCGDYLEGAEEALRSPELPAESRLALRAGQERVRTLQRHHLLTWARGAARSLTREAQQRVRLYEKVETANRALECIDSALKVYPDEEELNRSAGAVREFITSSRVAHWVELAERAAFKGHYRRAIDCYRDALFYLTRDSLDRDREATAERINREIELLKTRLSNHRAVVTATETAGPRAKRRRS